MKGEKAAGCGGMGENRYGCWGHKETKNGDMEGREIDWVVWRGIWKKDRGARRHIGLPSAWKVSERERESKRERDALEGSF